MADELWGSPGADKEEGLTFAESIAAQMESASANKNKKTKQQVHFARATVVLHTMHRVPDPEPLAVLQLCG